jgi:hypothetical protein
MTEQQATELIELLTLVTEQLDVVLWFFTVIILAISLIFAWCIFDALLRGKDAWRLW